MRVGIVRILEKKERKKRKNILILNLRGKVGGWIKIMSNKKSG
ncbi:hypothetical protein [Rappaport israeli]|nr:hypothetical protein [Rappaport israeli]